MPMPLKVRKRVAFALDDLHPMFDGVHHVIQGAACMILGHTPIVDGHLGKPYWVRCAYCSKELQ